MKIVFTIQAPVPLSFSAGVAGDAEAWRLLGYLSNGTTFPITHVVENPPVVKPYRAPHWQSPVALEDFKELMASYANTQLSTARQSAAEWMNGLSEYLQGRGYL